jgi:hypothetical protein
MIIIIISITFLTHAHLNFDIVFIIHRETLGASSSSPTNGYCMVKRILVTPSSIILLPYVSIKSCRMLRGYFVSASLSFMDPLFLIILFFCIYAFLAGLYGSV